MNLFYIMRKELSPRARIEIFSDISEITEIVGIDKSKIKAAVNNDDFSDIEDCLQVECSKEFNADYIITRNIKDFKNSAIKAILPDEFIKLVP